jgi:hypothetical protein
MPNTLPNVSPAALIDPRLRRIAATCLIAFPLLFLLVFLLHFQHPADFFHFHLRYTPAPPARVVAALIRYHNRLPLLADPHVVALLGLPILPVCCVALWLLGAPARPIASACAAFVTISGILYMAGIFAVWIAMYHGIGDVDPAHAAGATALFAAMTANQGAFRLITSLGKLGMIGFALQALTLVGVRGIPRWAIAAVVLGCGLFLAFWDLDNWMMLSTLLLLAGFIPISRTLANGGWRERNVPV